MRNLLTLALGLFLIGGQVTASPRGLVSPANASVPQGVSAGGFLLTPDLIVDERGQSVRVERGLLFVPENRRDLKSRLIAIHFTRFPALDARSSSRPPVFLLPGGPGWDFDFADPLVFDEVQRLRRSREVISVSQRGYPGSPGLVPDMRVTYAGGPIEASISARERAEKDRTSLAVALQNWRTRGVDVTGYDLINITDDVNDLRRALGYDKVVLRGCSFGSQWSLAFMRRWPKAVDRALLSGVEPLDFGYDSPDWLWNSMARVASAAEADPDLSRQIPRGGLMEALKTVIRRLQVEPARVSIVSPTDKGERLVFVGADDLRLLLTDLSLGQRRARDNLAQWPRFILEMHGGDYRFLATRAAEMRARERSEPLIIPLINHSTGITTARAKRLRSEAAARWLGDPNLKESVTRSVSPTPQVDDAFRSDTAIRIPVLLLSGDYDWSTPVENAEHLSRSLRHGHHVVVQGGRHCGETAFGEISSQSPESLDRIYSFIDADLDRVSSETFFKTLPSRLSLAPIDFASVKKPSLYDEWLARRQ